MSEAAAPVGEADGGGCGLDTNVLVRYLVADDAEQHEAAAALIDSFSPESPGLVHPVALVELVWVLQGAYSVPREAVVRALRLVLDVRSLRVLGEPDVRRAVDLYEAGMAEGQPAADFADCLLAAAYEAETAGLATFDKLASRLPGARRVRPV